MIDITEYLLPYFNASYFAIAAFLLFTASLVSSELFLSYVHAQRKTNTPKKPALLLGYWLLFSTIVYLVITKNHLLTYNLPIHHLLYAPSCKVIILFFSVISCLGDKYILSATALTMAIYLFYKKEKWAAFQWIAVCAGSVFLIRLLKYLIHSDRPINLLSQTGVYSASFPSGHTTLATILYSFAFAFFVRALTKKQAYFFGALTTAIICLVMLSRLSLGVHWFTDVMGGFFLGLICLSLARITLNGQSIPRDILIRTSRWGLLSLMVLWPIRAIPYLYTLQNIFNQ